MRRPLPWLPDSVEQAVADPLTAGADLDTVLDGVEAVVHLAGTNEVATAEEPERAMAETIALAHRVTVAAARAKVGRIVYASTVHVYGAALVAGAVVGETTVPEPRHPYAVARLAAEHLVATGPDPVIFRLTNCVGAPAHSEVSRWTLVANDLCRQAVAAGRVRLRTSGRQWRDFVDLGDACRILAAAATGELPAGTYNLGSGRPRTVLELAELICDRTELLTGRRPPLETGTDGDRGAAPASGDEAPPRVSVQALAGLGWVADTPLSSSLDELLAFCLAEQAL